MNRFLGASVVLTAWALTTNCSGSSNAQPRGDAAATKTVPAPSAHERNISRADYGDAWPFSVEGGVLSCVGPSQAVYFQVGNTRYAVNGSAKGLHDGSAVEDIWTSRPPSAPSLVVNRVPENDRREIFLNEAACPRQAQDAADARFPGASTLAEVKAMAAYEVKWREECIVKSRSKFHLSEKELDLIDAEGYALHWPPSKPVRSRSIGPIIDDGLKLCGK